METTYTLRGSGVRQGDVGLPLQSGGSRAPTDENVPVEEARILVRPARASVVGQIYKQIYKFTNLLYILGILRSTQY